MPFTPLHMGPSLVMKAALGRTFSVTVFGWSQILIDIQPLLVMLGYNGELHGTSHSLLGAAVIAIIAAITGKPLGELGLRIMRWDCYAPISWKIAFITAFIGTFSHVLIDSVMHVDVNLLYPFGTLNFLHGVVSISQLHQICIVSGVIGGGLFLLREWRRRK
ncbi:hypothetical protein ABT56_11855 [Photobacterium aquae]|uniref:Hydrolase n=1 Tax=Photobacterium aquae TaxID=1195763 RepID=A0A0J1H0P8_9GAMM|nr:metal-dependent hydrolase [Photobacterium aquae]KLV05403.1 hypothetical protein ABT56_11855 [Photobacterium aquae]